MVQGELFEIVALVLLQQSAYYVFNFWAVAQLKSCSGFGV
jgi:hypothetical protein